MQIAALAVVQGVTEFLPVSSSGHLVLIGHLIGVSGPQLAMDVALHVGTLLAVLLVFRADVRAMARGAFDLAKGAHTPGAALLLRLVVATLPMLPAGLLGRDLLVEHGRSIATVAGATMVFGIVLYLSDRREGRRAIEKMTLLDALLIGCAQMLAFIPGTSRSGIVLTAALFLGFRREDATRFAMLTAIPTLVAAGTLLAAGGLAPSDSLDWGGLATGAALAFVSAVLAIWGLLAWVRRASLTVFMVYRLVLGCALFLLLAWS
nr:undecaprenyl-diphosphate phosphatase [Roseomonas sp. SXEYE001]